jgi:hypothetical protein
MGEKAMFFGIELAAESIASLIFGLQASHWSA